MNNSTLPLETVRDALASHTGFSASPETPGPLDYARNSLLLQDPPVQFPGPLKIQPAKSTYSTIQSLIDAVAARNGFVREAVQTSAPMSERVLSILSKPVSFFKENGSNQDVTQAPLTEIAVLLDESSSMEHGKSSTVEGYNEQVRAIQDGAAGAGETRYTDVRFSHVVRFAQLRGDLAMLRPLTAATYLPAGGTALYDAIGKTIETLLSSPGIDNPKTAILMTVVTDGDERDSRTYTAETLRALIERLEATGRWTFAIVGPRGSVGAFAKTLAIRPDNVAGFDVNSVHERRHAFSQMSAASSSYMSMRSCGQTQASAGLYTGQP